MLTGLRWIIPPLLPADHLSLQFPEELRDAAPDHGGGSVGGVLLQPTAVQPRRQHGGGADAVHQQRHLRHQEPAHGGREAPVWDEGQSVSRDRWVTGRWGPTGTGVFIWSKQDTSIHFDVIKKTEAAVLLIPHDKKNVKWNKQYADDVLFLEP